MRRALRPLSAALLVSGALLVEPGAEVGLSGCSVVAGYEDLTFVPGKAPAFLGSAAIYSVYPRIFSPTGDLPGVTAQLPRIHDLGFDVVSLMPVTPIGQPTAQHPHSIGSPYCVHDYYAINPSYGTAADLKNLVSTAHQLGMYVVLDEEINQTSWDNALITSNPGYYVHGADGTIAAAFGLDDVAQLDFYSANGLDRYMTTMLGSWASTYDLDGFRFLNAGVTQGQPRIPQSFWQELQTSLATVKPQLLMWADEEDPTLAGNPFALDYGWSFRGGTAGSTGGAGLEQVAKGASATDLRAAWDATSYANAFHVNFLENWDLGEDITVYGGVPSAMAAATVDFTMNGVPMLWNGEEVASDSAAANTQAPIDWTGPNAASFTQFYKSLLVLRNGSTALQQGTVTWLPNSTPDSVVSFERSDSSATFVVVVNFSSSAVTVRMTPPAASGWTDESPTGSPGGKAHGASPASLSLLPYDFAVFRALSRAG